MSDKKEVKIEKEIKFDKKKLFRLGVNLVTTVCVSGVTSMIIKNNAIPANTKEKIMVAIGSFVVSDMITSKAEQHVSSQLDKLEELFGSIKVVDEKEE